MLFLPMCIYWDRDIAICFKEVLKDHNVSLIKEQIKLQRLCSVELKDADRTSKIKTKLGKKLKSLFSHNACFFILFVMYNSIYEKLILELQV